MAFFQTSKTADAVKDGGGEYISKSGMYPVTLKIVSVQTNDHNARSLNFNVDYKGSSTTLYGLKLDNNNGTPNYQAAIFNKLCVIADLDVVADPEIETHNLGKDKTPTDLSVLTDFTDLDVIIRVQEVYSIYKNELQSRLEIKGFYRADGASASEIVNGSEIGVQFEKDKAYASNVTYKDGLTAEKVAEMKAAKDGGKSQAAKPADKPAPVAKNLFA